MLLFRARDEESFSKTTTTRRDALLFFVALIKPFEKRAIKGEKSKGREREREKSMETKIIVLVYRDLDGDRSSGVSFNRRGLQPERFEMRQEMGRGTVVWVTHHHLKV